jgi:DNA recombination protein RmuC
MTPAWLAALGLAVLAAAALAVLLVVWLRKTRELDGLRRDLESRAPDPAMTLLQQQVGSLRETLSQALDSGNVRLDKRLDAFSRNVGERLEASRKSLDQRLESTSKVVHEVQRSLGQVDASVRGFTEISRDIRALQDILKAPKLRGGLGEFFLGDLLAQILPPSHYSLQYGFTGGERVDAVLKVGDRLVPVDAKFPLENFRRVVEADDEESRRRERRAFVVDLRKHVSDIANKYIRPEEKTYDFALMYIPAENVYYEAVLREEELAEEKGILSYALSRRVIPVSPNSFYAYLQVILIGLRGLRIEAQAQQILDRIQALGAEFSRLSDDFNVAGKHLRNSLARYDDAGKRVDRFQTRLLALSELGGPETAELDGEQPEAMEAATPATDGDG